MAIVDDNQASSGAAATERAAPQAQAPQQQQATKPSGISAMGFHSGALFGAPISRNLGSEFYGKVKAGLAEVYKGANDAVELAILDLDNDSEPALYFSSLIIAMRSKEHPKLGVAYHILSLEATGDRIAPQFEQMGNISVEVTRAPCDAVDEMLLTRARDRVSRAYNGAVSFFCDAAIVPADFNPEDKTAMHRLALNAAMACATELKTREPGFRDLNLAEIPTDSSLHIGMTFKRTNIQDAVGLPVRSDIQIVFSSKRNNQQRNGSLNSGDREVKAYEASAFVDMVWAPQTTQGANRGWGNDPQAPKQKYAARLVITDMRSDLSYTPASMLLALLSATTVRDENNWIQVHRPMQVQPGEIDLTDIGALNIEANSEGDPSGYGTHVNTKVDSFKLTDLGQYASRLIHPGLIVSIDCPEFGASSWYTSLLISASRGRGEALRIMYEAAMTLTNGNFEKYFRPGMPMFSGPGTRIHMGTWVDRTGTKRDLREIDHIAICNLFGERQPNLMRDFSDSYLNENEPINKRLATRKRILMGATNDSAVITGFAQRLTFSREFIDALNQGVRETGLQVRVTTPLSGADFNNQRAVAGFASSAMLAPGQTFQQVGYGGFPAAGGHYGGGDFRYNG